MKDKTLAQMVAEAEFLMNRAATQLADYHQVINVVARYQRHEMSSELAMHEIEMILMKENR